MNCSIRLLLTVWIAPVRPNAVALARRMASLNQFQGSESSFDCADFDVMEVLLREERLRAVFHERSQSGFCGKRFFVVSRCGVVGL